MYMYVFKNEEKFTEFRNIHAYTPRNKNFSFWINRPPEIKNHPIYMAVELYNNYKVEKPLEVQII